MLLLIVQPNVSSIYHHVASDLEPLKKKAKQVIKKMTVTSQRKLSIEDGRYTYQYESLYSYSFIRFTFYLAILLNKM